MGSSHREQSWGIDHEEKATVPEEKERGEQNQVCYDAFWGSSVAKWTQLGQARQIAARHAPALALKDRPARLRMVRRTNILCVAVGIWRALGGEP
jgi:hypothetical protein